MVSTAQQTQCVTRKVYSFQGINSKYIWLNNVTFLRHSLESPILCSLYPLSSCTRFLKNFSLKYQVWWTGFLVYFKLEFYWLQQAEKSSSNLEKNPFHQTWYFKLVNCKNQVQIDRRIEWHNSVCGGGEKEIQFPAWKLLTPLRQKRLMTFHICSHQMDETFSNGAFCISYPWWYVLLGSYYTYWYYYMYCLNFFG